MNIPDEMLPKVLELDNGQQVKLPAIPLDWGRRSIKDLSHEEKARRYLEEACRTLALFKYWASKAE